MDSSHADPLEPVDRPPTICEVIEAHATAAYTAGEYGFGDFLASLMVEPGTGPGGPPRTLP